MDKPIFVLMFVLMVPTTLYASVLCAAQANKSKQWQDYVFYYGTCLAMGVMTGWTLWMTWFEEGVK